MKQKEGQCNGSEESGYLGWNGGYFVDRGKQICKKSIHDRIGFTT